MAKTIEEMEFDAAMREELLKARAACFETAIASLNRKMVQS